MTPVFSEELSELIARGLIHNAVAHRRSAWHRTRGGDRFLGWAIRQMIRECAERSIARHLVVPQIVGGLIQRRRGTP